MAAMALSEEEDATFQAALSFLEECDLAAQELQDPADSDDHPEPAPSPCSSSRSSQQNDHTDKQGTKRRQRPPGYNANRARDARRDELIYLRSTVRNLENELQALQSNGHDRLTAAGEENSSGNQDLAPHFGSSTAAMRASQRPNGASSVASMWEDVAARQYEERRRAELENIRLKNFLEQQLKVARGLERLLHKRTTWEAIHSGNRTRLTDLHCSLSDGEDAAMFQYLMAGVEQSLANVDLVLETNGLDKMETPFSDARVRHDGTNGMVLEIFANRLIPFDMHASGNAVWRHFAHAMENLPSRVYYPQHLETTPDTVVERFGVEIENRNTKAEYHVRQVLRKRVDEERIVIVWRCVMEMVSFSGEPTTGISLPETGYIIIKRPKTLPAESTTLMQMCYIITPNIYIHNQQKIGALTDFVLHTVIGTISASHQLIENFLIDQSMRKSSNQQSHDPDGGDDVLAS